VSTTNLVVDPVEEDETSGAGVPTHGRCWGNCGGNWIEPLGIEFEKRFAGRTPDQYCCVVVEINSTRAGVSIQSNVSKQRG
jgi:hypothetical protein